MSKPRENWGSKIGIVLAVAGSAVGLGNFLRFPSEVVQNGGGAFMIPYFIAFLFLGIPIAFAEWTLGRYGGQYGRGSAPGVFDVVARKWWAKYLGIFGLFVPLVINFFYLVIESWCLAYSAFSLLGYYSPITNPADMKDLLTEFQGLAPAKQLPDLPWLYIFFFVTFGVNYWIVSRGIVSGIERLNKICMPLLFLLAGFLFVRVLTLGTPNPSLPDQNVANGLGFMWNPDFSALLNVDVWMAAAGQIFSTLSVGMGAILAYSSYLKKDDDVAHSALSSATTNEFAEVILAGTIIIPATFIFLGAVGAKEVAQSGSFNLGFVTMPLIFNQLPLGSVFGFMWFFLLTLAGITSSVSLIQPILTFMQDELHISRVRATIIIGALTLLVGFVLIQTIALGTIDEFNFWGGTFLPVVSALVMVWIFSWIFGAKEGWEELNRSSHIKIPRLFVSVIKYIKPLYLLVMLSLWVWKNVPIITMSAIADPKVWHTTIWTRIWLLLLIAILILAIYYAGRDYATSKPTSGKGNES
ncbi:MAG: sodium-dependent transporter [bacterium]|nr:sodium-dependent transporter [bacterium]